jgi:hypothetical protein
VARAGETESGSDPPADDALHTDESVAPDDPLRELLLAAASRVFASKGYYGTKVMDIVREAGLSSCSASLSVRGPRWLAVLRTMNSAVPPASGGGTDALSKVARTTAAVSRSFLDLKRPYSAPLECRSMDLAAEDCYLVAQHVERCHEQAVPAVPLRGAHADQLD